MKLSDPRCLSETYILDLPPECLGYILSYISDTMTLQSLLRVNKTIAEITRENIECIDHGDTKFLCQFRRLSTVRTPISLYTMADFNRISMLPRLRVVSLLLTSTYFQNVCRSIVEGAMSKSEHDTRERWNIESDIIDLIRTNFEQILSDSLKLVPIMVYTRCFLTAVETFILSMSMDSVFSFETHDENCIYSKIEIGDMGRLSIDIREIELPRINIHIPTLVFQQGNLSPFPSLRMPISHLRCPSIFLDDRFRGDIVKIIPNLKELVIVTPTDHHIQTRVVDEMISKSSLLIVNFELRGQPRYHPGED